MTSFAPVWLTAALSFGSVSTDSVALPSQQRISAARDLCNRYMESCGSKTTNLVYGYRLDTAKGLASFEPADFMARERVHGVRRDLSSKRLG